MAFIGVRTRGAMREERSSRFVRPLAATLRREARAPLAQQITGPDERAPGAAILVANPRSLLLRQRVPLALQRFLAELSSGGHVGTINSAPSHAPSRSLDHKRDDSANLVGGAPSKRRPLQHRGDQAIKRGRGHGHASTVRPNRFHRSGPTPPRVGRWRPKVRPEASRHLSSPGQYAGNACNRRWGYRD